MTEPCTCAPCCQCGYVGQDSDGADCYGKKGRTVLKPGVGLFFGPHCFCWHASEADCPVHGSPESGEALADLEPCPNSPFRLEAVCNCCGGMRSMMCGDCAAGRHDHGCSLDPSAKKVCKECAALGQDGRLCTHGGEQRGS